VEYQYNFSENYPELYINENRINKAKKTLAILKDYLRDLNQLELLDIGSSTGIMTNEYAKNFREVTGIDIDKEAIKFSKENFQRDNLTFLHQPIEELNNGKKKFDVITCSHIYEHVPNANLLIDEIYRLLKPGGVCYFAAGNKYKVMEGHYRLPFLSYFPKKISNFYLKILNKGDYYYENHLSVIKLRKLVSKFQVVDYTLAVIDNPDLFSANELLIKNSFKHKFIKSIARYFYFFIPTYIWILVKK
tara:strand:+ start:10703 stop:11443 length:741 start_codon:yes stop_codon:yes gene_type:complete